MSKSYQIKCQNEKERKKIQDLIQLERKAGETVSQCLFRILEERVKYPMNSVCGVLERHGLEIKAKKDFVLNGKGIKNAVVNKTNNLKNVFTNYKYEVLEELIEKEMEAVK